MADVPVEIVGVSVLPEAHFACQGTGMCCQGYQFGPIADDVAARIEAHPFVENAARIAAAGGPFTVTEVHGEPMRVLSRHQGRCVFLADDGLCVVHKELGGDAKPALCKLYPLNVAVAPDGVAYVSLNMECAGYAKGRHGPPLIETVAEHLDLIGALPTLALSDTVVVRPGVTLAYDEAFDRYEAPWLEDLDAPRAPATLVADLCARLVGRLRHPIPERTWPEAQQAALHALAGRAAFYARQVAARERAEGDPVDADLHLALADAAEAATLQGAVALGAVPGDEADDLLRTHLQHAVFGKALHRAPSLAAGLGFEAFKLWLVAADAERAGGDAEAVVAALRRVNRCLRPSDLVHVGPDVEARCVELCDALGAR